jgi:hypothetical protein
MIPLGRSLDVPCGWKRNLVWIFPRAFTEEYHVQSRASKPPIQVSVEHHYSIALRIPLAQTVFGRAQLDWPKLCWLVSGSWSRLMPLPLDVDELRQTCVQDVQLWLMAGFPTDALLRLFSAPLEQLAIAA